jgi:hypothetical protein
MKPHYKRVHASCTHAFQETIIKQAQITSETTQKRRRSRGKKISPHWGSNPGPADDLVKSRLLYQRSSAGCYHLDVNESLCCELFHFSKSTRFVTLYAEP